MKIIPLTQGQFAIIDDDDYDLVIAYKWQAQRQRGVDPDRTWYATRPYWDETGRRRCMRLHRFILGLGSGRVPEVDHRDGDGLNCRRANLRICSLRENQANKRAFGTSGFKGVYLKTDHRRVKPWKAYIRENERSRNLGMYATAEEAAHVYDFHARRVYGEFAKLNFPEHG